MQKLLKNKTVIQFIKFGVIGVSGTLIDWGAFFVFNKYLGVYYLLAKVLSFVLAVINSYIWNRSWTFRSKNPNKTSEFIKFIIVSTIGLGLNTLIFDFSVKYLHFAFLPASVPLYLPPLFIASGIVMIWNFAANKLWVFKEPVIIE